MDELNRVQLYSLDRYHDIDSGNFIFENAETLMQLLIIYKDKLQINSYMVEDTPLSIWRYDGGKTRPERNALLIGGEKLGAQYYDELISGFVNASIQYDDVLYEVYLNPESALTQICVAGAESSDVDELRSSDIYGYATEQMFMAIITKLMPWHFGDIDEEHKAVLREAATQIVERGRSYVLEEFEETVKSNGAQNEIARRQLENIGKEIIEQRISKLRNNLETYQINYDDYYRRLTETMQLLQQTKAQICAIENSTDEVENPIREITEFLDTTPLDFFIDSVQGKTIYLGYRVPLTVYDNEEDYISLIKNNLGTSYFFNSIRHSSDYSNEALKKAYKHIIEDRDCIVWVGGTMSLDMDTLRFHAENAPTKKNTGIHPHLNGGLSCFGTAEGPLRDLLTNYRLFEAMNQISYCIQQFTVSDVYAGENLLQGIEQYECIECPDGVWRNIYQLMDAVEKEVF